MYLDFLSRLTDDSFPWAVARRRELHRVPEEGFAEFKTQKLICKALDELGIPYSTDRTWVIGLIEGAHPGRVIALRADMDALPIDEPKGCAFRSEHEGWMHACGHDIHMAIQLGAARMLMQLRDKLHGSVKLLFQPAEETTGGALPMIQAGALENPHVDACYGLHVDTSMPLGTIEARHGAVNASTDEIYITVHGRSGHAAYPERSIDAIVCAAQIVTALQTLVSRSISPLSSAVLTFGSVSGGRTNNIICDRVQLFGTLRTADPKLRTYAQRKIREISQGIALAYGATADIEVHSGYSVLVNHDRETELVLSLAQELFGHCHVRSKSAPSMGGEDFAYFAENVPASFYHLGCTPLEGLPGYPGHSLHFAPDERCIRQGIMMQTALVLAECDFRDTNEL